MQRVTPRRARGLFLVLAALMLTALACGNLPQEPDTQATVRAFYTTITAQAASGSPFPTRPVSTQPAAPGGDGGDDQEPTEAPSPTPRPTNTPPAEGRSGNGLNFTIPRCGSDITVDGNDGDWGFYRGAILNASEPTYGEGEWQGAHDLSGEIRLCWNDTFLYFIANVADDIHVQREQGIRSYLGDEIEVLIDGDLFGDFYDDETSDDDNHFSFNPGNFSDLPPDVVMYVPYQDEDPGQAAIGARRPIGVGAGYMLEGAIPWGMTTAAPQTGRLIGLCIALSDNDHVETSQQDTMVSHCTNLRTPDPTSWATAQFGQ